MTWWITDGIYKDKKESGKLCKTEFKLNPSFDNAQQILQFKNLRDTIYLSSKGQSLLILFVLYSTLFGN